VPSIQRVLTCDLNANEYLSFIIAVNISSCEKDEKYYKYLLAFVSTNAIIFLDVCFLKTEKGTLQSTLEGRFFLQFLEVRMKLEKMTKTQLIRWIRENLDYQEKVVQIKSSNDVFSSVVELITEWKQEHLIVLYLDSANKIILKEVVFKGTLNSTTVHPREIFALALSYRAASIIIAHNHPTGNLKPSQEDIAVTKRLVETGLIMGIEILDHVIFSANNEWSFKANGLL